MGNLLVGRVCIATIGTLQVRNLAMSFKVKKDLKSKPNTCELKIRNLAEAHQAQIEENPNVAVQLEAGYESGTSVIFIGDLRTAPTETDGTDDVTTVSSGDGEKKHKTARVTKSHAKGATSAVVIKSLVDAIGVSPGNSASAISAITSSGVGELFTLGTALCGSAAREMTRILRAVGYTWSIQNGALQLLTTKQTVAGSAIKVDQTTGLIGSPSVDSDGVLSCKIQIVPDVFPGRLMVLQSKGISGQYRIEETEHTGDNYGSDWQIAVKAKPY